jgi:hypothetical protein
VKPTGKELRVTILFIVLQTILYVSFLTFDLAGNNTELSSSIKYLVIILCFCYVLLPVRGLDKGIVFYLRVAMFFTVISDLFLLLLDLSFFGVLTFIIVQQVYSCMLINIQKKEEAKVAVIKNNRSRNSILLQRLGLQITLTIIVMAVLSYIDIMINSLLIITVFYFISIFTNVILAIKTSFQDHKNRARLIFAVGMVLFLLCDINVGIFNMSGFITLPVDLYNKLYSVSSLLMWVFYAPAQVLIVLSKYQKCL